ncbi:MAG: sulfatase [Candidatus Nanohaloarchaea archaeon]
MAERPNIVLVVMDAARAKNFSCYGYGEETSPFIDSIAEEGIKFENCFANAPWTLPSHWSMFTGKLPNEHGKIDREKRGPIDVESMPQKLSDQGYTTVAISNNGYVSSLYGFKDVFDIFEFNAQGLEESPEIFFQDEKLFNELIEGEQEGRWQSSKEKYLYFAKNFLKRPHPKTIANTFYFIYRKKITGVQDGWSDDGAEHTNSYVAENEPKWEEPYFLFINYAETHTKYMPPKKYAEKYLGDISLEEAHEYADRSSTDYLVEGGDEKAAEVLESLYNGEINFIDTKIEELHDRVTGDRDTVFIVLSDHGDYIGEHGLWGHQARLRKDILHVPAVISGLGSDSIESPFPLRKINDVVLEAAEGEEPELEELAAENVFTEYYGIQSNNFSARDKGLPEEYFRVQYSIVDRKSLFVLDSEGEERAYPSTLDVEARKNEILQVIGKPRNLDTEVDEIDV